MDLLWLLSLLTTAHAVSPPPPPLQDCFNHTSLPYRTTGARLNVLSYDTTINTIESAMHACLLNPNCASIGEEFNFMHHRITLHGPGTLFEDLSMRTYLRLSSCTPPSPPPQPPAAPSPTFSCADLAGRVNARNLTHARWCFQLSRTSLTCADYYAKGTGDYHVCYDPGDGRFCADASNQLRCDVSERAALNAPPATPAEPPSQSSQLDWVWWTIVAVVVALNVAIIAISFMRHKKRAISASRAQVPTSSVVRADQVFDGKNTTYRQMG